MVTESAEQLLCIVGVIFEEYATIEVENERWKLQVF